MVFSLLEINFVFKFSYRNEFSENSSLPQFDAFENITGEAVPAY